MINVRVLLVAMVGELPPPGVSCDGTETVGLNVGTSVGMDGGPGTYVSDPTGT